MSDAELERELVRLRKINQSLIGRVERAMNMQGDAFALFQAATVLEQKVQERTAALEQALRELRSANRDLQHAKETAEAAVRFKDEFLASMSHELRTPLNAVLGLSEALQDGVYGGMSAKQDECLRTIEASGRHLLALINDILDVAKSGAGELKAELTALAIVPVCRACIRLIEPQAQRKLISVKLDVASTASQLRSDEKRLKQILVNLLSNAVKFTPNGGSVELGVALDNDRSKVLFTVSDTGIGIAESDLARVFLPFVQVESGLSRRYEGTGLGLALVQQLATLLGGSVSVESTLGVGSRFTVMLPADPQAACALPSGRPPSAQDPAAWRAEPGGSPNARGRILLAEDNAANQKTIGDYLRARGYAVELAHNGREAVEKLHLNPFDLVLMDVQMPEMDGLAALGLIRAREGAPRTPIIAITALAMSEDRERALAAGADDYLAKPLVLRDLVNRIESLLAHSRSAPHASAR